jgi:hypothetical protein
MQYDRKMTKRFMHYNSPIIIIIIVTLISFTVWNLVYQQHYVIDKFRRPMMLMSTKNNNLAMSNAMKYYQWKATLRDDDDEEGDGKQNERHNSNNNTNITSTTTNNDNNIATPLFYHVSPGSTGSRSLYHAACLAGYPSVHHKSFCISNTRGISSSNTTAAISKDVVRGVRSHFEIIRLYTMAYECCKLYSKGKLITTTITDLTYVNRNHHLCYTPLHTWITELQSHLAIVIQNSDLVGIFDTPYPYLSRQIVQLTNNNDLSTYIVLLTRIKHSSTVKPPSRRRLNNRIGPLCFLHVPT